MADTSYPILYEGSNESSLTLFAASAPIDLECFPMTAREELKGQADEAASGVHNFMQRTFANGARSAKAGEVKEILEKLLGEDSSLSRFATQFGEGAAQVEKSETWTIDLASQEGISKQIEIRVAPEYLYKDRGDHLEMYLWVVLGVFLKRSETDNQNTPLFHGSYTYTKHFKFSLAGAPAAIEQDASTDSDWSDSSDTENDAKRTGASMASNATKLESIILDIRTLFTGTSLEKSNLAGDSVE